jgi:hypothetical protein
MALSVAGSPLHTRTLSVALAHRDAVEVGFAAYLLDLRKRGFAPVGGDLQGTGIIHHMRLDGVIDRRTRTIVRIGAQMPTVAFEATPSTGGESCRDLVGRVDNLAGLALGDGYSRGLGDEIGATRGCSHVLTLAHLLGPTARWALAEDERLHGAGVARRGGERIFRRDVSVDGYELEPGRLMLSAQLNDLHCAPTPTLARPMQRLAAQREIAISGRLTVPDLVLDALDATERRRTPADIADSQWVAHSERVAPLIGVSLRPGVSGALLRHFADAPDEAPLRDALLMLAPALIQCFAALDLWNMQAADVSAVGESGGFPDSCYMWRRGSTLQRNRGVV